MDGSQNTEGQEKPLNIENDEDEKLLERTRRWVDERSSPKVEMIKHPKLATRLFWMRNARFQIYRDIERDIRTYGLANNLTPEAVSTRAAFVGEEPRIVEFTDILSGKQFYQVLRKQGEDIIAEERIC